MIGSSRRSTADVVVRRHDLAVLGRSEEMS